VRVEKEAVVREEAGVRKEVVEHTEQMRDTVRSEELEVKNGQEPVSEAGTCETQREPRRSQAPLGSPAERVFTRSSACS
jgi:hypothetical protein